MKNIYKKLLVAAVSFTGIATTEAQVASYAFQQYQSIYAAVSGGTVFGIPTSDDDYFTNAGNPTASSATGPGIPIGFNFTYNGTVYDVFGLQNNGWISFGQSTLTPNPVNMQVSSAYTGISGTSTAPTLLQNRVAALSRDIRGNGNGNLRVQTIGTAPTRTCVIQWTNYMIFGGSDAFDFQMKLNETTNIISVTYGNWVPTSTSGAEVGLRGTTNADFNNRNVTNPNVWATSIAGTANNALASWNPTGLKPVSGQKYEWIPPNPCTPLALSSNTVVPSLTLVCPNGGALISLATTYTETGLAYQWVSSQVSAVGPFTPVVVGTPTNASYIASGIGVPTWYQAVVTCTNPGGLTTSLTASGVNVQGITTSNVPYFEGFEGIQLPGQLPNCSWALTNTATATTYTAATTQNRIPFQGQKFASFFSTSGTNYFYTNGIQLNAGVTYSASMMFITDFSGSPTFSDLSMLIGTAQSPTGLVPVASTGGPAISGTYKLLSNTFSVPSSGLYYLAIRSTAGGGAVYLSFDNVAIDIPCSLNSPTISVSGPTVACSGSPLNLTATGANTYMWNTGATTPGISTTPVVAGTSLVNYIVVGTNTLANCSTSVVKSVLVNEAPQINIFTIDPNNMVCPGETATLYAFGSASSYTWSTTGVAGPNTTVSPTSNTTYTVIGSSPTGCTATKTIEIGVKQSPSVSGATSKPVLCVGETAVLTGNGATTYTWIANTGVSGVYYGSPINVSPNVQTIYQLVGTDASTGCSNTITVVQGVNGCTGINELTSGNGVSVYPNPNNGEFTVESGTTSVKTIEVTDLTGRVLLSSTSAEQNTQVNISNFAKGIYYVRIQSDNSVNVVKVIKN